MRNKQPAVRHKQTPVYRYGARAHFYLCAINGLSVHADVLEEISDDLAGRFSFSGIRTGVLIRPVKARVPKGFRF